MGWGVAAAAGIGLGQALLQQSMQPAQMGFGEWLNQAQASHIFGERYANIREVKSFKNKMILGNAYGIHPLAMLGQPMAPSRPQSIGAVRQKKGPKLGTMGQDISRAIMAMKTPEEKAKIKAETKEVEAREKYFTSMSKKIEGDIDSTPGVSTDDMGIVQGQNQGSIKGVITEPSRRTASRTVGLEAGIKPYEQQTITKDHYLKTMYTRDISEAAESEWTDPIEKVVGRGVTALRKLLGHAWAFTSTAMEDRNKIRKWFRSIDEPGEGWEWRIEWPTMRTRRYKMVKGKSQLYNWHPVENPPGHRWPYKEVEYRKGKKQRFKIKNTKRR